MLKDKTSSAIVAVSDLERARRFYRDTLGLTIAEDDGEMVVVFLTGVTQLVVYASEFAGTGKANAVVWDAGGEIEAIVADLKSKGVVFEHYPESDGFRLDGDIHRSGEMSMVWFKDPDGNILHLNQMGAAV